MGVWRGSSCRMLKLFSEGLMIAVATFHEDGTNYAFVLDLQSRFRDTAVSYRETDAQEAVQCKQHKHFDTEGVSPQHDETNKPSGLLQLQFFERIS
jgi:hypothetical protein